MSQQLEQISRWLKSARRDIAQHLDMIGRKSDAQGAMLHTIISKQDELMRTVADIKVAEQEQGTILEEQGAKIDALIALTDAIFQKLGPVSEDPAVQEVLDMISARRATIDARNASMDETMRRDTPTDTTTPAG